MLLLESGDGLLLETGVDYLLLEGAVQEELADPFTLSGVTVHTIVGANSEADPFDVSDATASGVILSQEEPDGFTLSADNPVYATIPQESADPFTFSSAYDTDFAYAYDELLTASGATVHGLVASHSVLDTAAISEAYTYDFGVAISEIIEILKATDTDWAAGVLEDVNVTTALTLHNTRTLTVAEVVALRETFLAVYEALIAETAALSDAESYMMSTILVDQIAATGAVTTQLQAVQTLATLFAIAEIIEAGGDAVDIAEIVNIAQSYVQQLVVTLAQPDGFTLSAEASGIFSGYAEVSEEVGIDDAVTLAQALGILLAEGVDFSATLSLGDEVYSAWTLNTDSRGVSRYTNFPFNSLGYFNSGYYGAADDGIYELTGTDDAGTDIDAVIRTGLNKFGSTSKKSFTDAYIGATESGDLVIKAICGDGDTKTEAWYRLQPGVFREGNFRTKIGRGLRGVYWQFELVNVAGSDLDIDTLILRPLDLSRKV